MFGRDVDDLLRTSAPTVPSAPLGHTENEPRDEHDEPPTGHIWRSGALPVLFEEVTRTLMGPLERRRFLALSGAALTAAAHEWLITDPARVTAALAGRLADAPVIADLTTTVDVLRRLDDKLGGQAVYGMVTEQLRLVTGLLRNASYTEAHGRDLYALAAELFRLAGWTAYDSGAHGTAQRYYLLGLRTAHEADAPGIAANILRCMAEAADSAYDPRVPIDLLRSANAGARDRLSHTERAAIAARLSRAYGRLGDRHATVASLNTAYAEFEQAQPTEAPPYSYWVGAPTIAHDAGAALLHAGDAAAAIPHLQASVSHTAPDMPRELLQVQALLALAYAKSGDADAAVSLTHDAIGTASVPSAILGDHFAEVCAAVRAAGHAGANNLVEHVRASLRTAMTQS